MPDEFTRDELTHRLCIDEVQADAIIDLLYEGGAPDEYPSVEAWVARCYSEPAHDEKVMLALNEILNGFGVEAITPDGEIYPKADYVNNGDSYKPTIVRDIETGEFLLCRWADWLEQYEAENAQQALPVDHPLRSCQGRTDRCGPQFLSAFGVCHALHRHETLR